MFSLATAAAPYAPRLLYGFGKGTGPDGEGPSSGPTLLPDNTLIGTTDDSLYIFDQDLPHHGTDLWRFRDGGQIEPQPVLGPHGTVFGPLQSGGTTPCLANNGDVISSGGCGEIYSESRGP